MSGASFRQTEEQDRLQSDTTSVALESADRRFVVEAMCIPMLMIIHRLAYNLSGFLLDRQDADYGSALMTLGDLYIPYVSIFVVPYAGTWLLGLGMIAYALVYRTGNYLVFRGIYAAVLFTTLLEFLIWILFPASISLRVEMHVLQAGGVFDQWLATIYASATPWNVFPSAHVGFAAMVWLYSKHLALPQHRVWFLLCCISICLSVLFVRNHYLLDIPAGIAVTYIGYSMVFLPCIKSSALNLLSSSNVILAVGAICCATILGTWLVMGDSWSL